MRTNIEIDDQLIEQVKKEANLKTRKEAVHVALENYLRVLRRRKLASLRGKVEWVGNLAQMRRD
jgi:Arc/MetJ family transcription regulator